MIDTLRGIAPTFAVRGNVDTASWAAPLPMTERVEAGALRVFVLHEISQLDLDPGAAGLAAVVFGHSHMPSIETRGGVLFLNPGSAGPRRFKLPVAVARATVSGSSCARRSWSCRSRSMTRTPGARRGRCARSGCP